MTNAGMQVEHETVTHLARGFDPYAAVGTQVEHETVTHLARDFDPYAAQIHFGWSATCFGLYLYLNVGIVAFLWLVRHCQPTTRERCLRRAIWAECFLFIVAVVWAVLGLSRLHSASHDMAASEMDRTFALAALVQARDGVVTPAIVSGVIGLCVTHLLWRGARKVLVENAQKEKRDCEPQGGGYSPSAVRPSKPTP